MEIKFIEGTNGFNWGKFMLAKFNADEWSYQSKIDDNLLLRSRGWNHRHLWVFDLQTGEAFYCMPGGLAAADLNKRQIWVCPMFEPFLEWLYTQNTEDIQNLPDTVDLVGESSLHGHRRSGESISGIFTEKTAKLLNDLDIFIVSELRAMTRKAFVASMGKNKKAVQEIDSVFRSKAYRFHGDKE